jgi:hypothetical protein
MRTVLEKLEIFSAVLQGKLHTVLEIVFCQVNVVCLVGKGNLRLNRSPSSETIPCRISIVFR